MRISHSIARVGVLFAVGCTRVTATAHVPAAKPIAPPSAEATVTSWAILAGDAGPLAALTDEAMENSDACLEPVGVLGDGGLDVYERYVRRAIGFPPASDAIAAVMIRPSFEPIRMLSLHRQRRGKLILRLTRLTKDVWAEMLREMEAQQGSTIHLSDPHQAAALARISVATTSRERTVDGETARLIEKLLSSLLGRAQPVQEVGVATAKADGTDYAFWQPDKEGKADSPRDGSILGLAASAVEDLCRLIESPSASDGASFRRVCDEMAVALDRSRRNEPCLRPYRE